MLDQRKARGFELITARILKQLPKARLVNLMYVVYIQLHTTTRILAAIIKYSTNNNDTQTWENSLEVLSHRPISLLLINLKTRKYYTKK